MYVTADLRPDTHVAPNGAKRFFGVSEPFLVVLCNSWRELRVRVCELSALFTGLAKNCVKHAYSIQLSWKPNTR
jgi:hypothetical protein